MSYLQQNANVEVASFQKSDRPMSASPHPELDAHMPAVEVATNLLASICNSLTAKIDAIEKAFGPVLTPINSPPGSMPSQPAKEQKSPLAMDIFDVADKLENNLRRLDEFMARSEV